MRGRGRYISESSKLLWRRQGQIDDSRPNSLIEAAIRRGCEPMCGSGRGRGFEEDGQAVRGSFMLAVHVW